MKMKIAFKSIWNKIKKLKLKLAKHILVTHDMRPSGAKLLSNVIFILILIIILIFTPITLPVLAILFMIYDFWLQRHIQKVMSRKWKIRQNKHIYFRKIAPYNWKFYIPIHLPQVNYVQFGGARDKEKGIKYMFVMDGQKIIIPESKFGENRQYYLTNISFTAHFDIKHNQLPSVALLTFVQTNNFKNSFRIAVNNVTSDYVHILKVYFQLTTIQKKHLHL